MNKEKIKDAIETINDAILNLNEFKGDSEDFYWWNGVLDIFGLETDGNGGIVLADKQFFKEWVVDHHERSI